jgi:hypothetical protein
MEELHERYRNSGPLFNMASSEMRWKINQVTKEKKMENEKANLSDIISPKIY